MKHKTKYKHIYSDSLKNGLDIEIDSKYATDTHNPIRQLQALYYIPNSIWSEYLSDIMYDKMPIKRKDVWNDISLILKEVNNQKISNIVIETLMKIENFDPYEEHFPFYEFHTNTRNLLQKKSNFIKQYYNYVKPITIDNIIGIMLYNDERVDIKTYLSIFDFVILFDSNNMMLLISKEAKEFLNLKPLLEYFNQIDGNKWTISKDKMTLYIKNKDITTSKIKIYSNEKIIEEYIKKIIVKQKENNNFEQKLSNYLYSIGYIDE